MNQKKSAREQNKVIPKKIKLEVVICPYCQNGKRANKKMCVLCEGTGHIEAMP